MVGIHRNEPECNISFGSRGSGVQIPLPRYLFRCLFRSLTDHSPLACSRTSLPTSIPAYRPGNHSANPKAASWVDAQWVAPKQWPALGLRSESGGSPSAARQAQLVGTS
jgi:hypothetical protein